MRAVHLQVYIWLLVVVLVLYVVNLFFINPITCWFKEGCCFVKNERLHVVKKARNRRAQKYLAASNQSGINNTHNDVSDLEMAQNLEN